MEPPGGISSGPNESTPMKPAAGELHLKRGSLAPVPLPPPAVFQVIVRSSQPTVEVTVGAS
jgi:hypothetical protein